MTLDEIKEYLAAELEEERKRYLAGKENHYSYIFMICNDIGITEKQ